VINVTRTLLPPLEEYVAYLEKIWASGQVTNNGALVRELEQRLQEYLGAAHVVYVANGTLGLQLALRALDARRKVLTTPFSYVATTGALLWEHCTPVFVDVDPDTLCMDPVAAAKAVDGQTDAILAVHVYGIPCDTAALQSLADQRGLRLLYDAAHAFGTRVRGRQLAAAGDASVLSFHATKLFHTVEGGAIVTDDAALARRLRLHRAFGHIGEEHITVGINAKNSEFHAAMGLCLLPRIDSIIASRRELTRRYDQLLDGAPVRRPRATAPGIQPNCAYYPVLLPTEASVRQVQAALGRVGVVPRRYFHPALNRLPYRSGEPCPRAEDAASRILCLPMSHEVTEGIQQDVVAAIRDVLAG
jgi:dTDP-4-amino-4,6-dideoxygalactose transaminase